MPRANHAAHDGDCDSEHLTLPCVPVPAVPTVPQLNCLLVFGLETGQPANCPGGVPVDRRLGSGVLASSVG